THAPGTGRAVGERCQRPPRRDPEALGGLLYPPMPSDPSVARDSARVSTMLSPIDWLARRYSLLIIAQGNVVHAALREQSCGARCCGTVGVARHLVSEQFL